MEPIYIKSPEGRIIAAPRGAVTVTNVGGNLKRSVNADALKPGWSVATDDDLAAMAKANAAADAQRDADALVSSPDHIIKASVAEAVAAAMAAAKKED